MEESGAGHPSLGRAGGRLLIGHSALRVGPSARPDPEIVRLPSPKYP